MKTLTLAVLCLPIAAAPALAVPEAEQGGSLSYCVSQTEAREAAPQRPETGAWAVEIAGAFSKEQALDRFARMKQEYTDVLGGFDPVLVEQCNLSLGSKLRYSARIVLQTRDDADSLCSKLQQSGGACIVQRD